MQVIFYSIETYILIMSMIYYQIFKSLCTCCFQNCHSYVFIHFVAQWFMVLIFKFLKPNNCFINFELLLKIITNKNKPWHPDTPPNSFLFNAHCHGVVKDSMMYPKYKSTSPCQPDVDCIFKSYSMHHQWHLESHHWQHVLPKQPTTLIILLQLWMFVSQSVIQNLTI